MPASIHVRELQMVGLLFPLTPSSETHSSYLTPPQLDTVPARPMQARITLNVTKNLSVLIGVPVGEEGEGVFTDTSEIEREWR
ncbi:hypothetical protein BaRGS_00013395 [Batillaria attramentaria]|uniref:Uncharacterized protein n=1 Tax=Batillaria attramentaria TaxID=370345 RepID=A0ABD0L871_9CAEN